MTHEVYVARDIDGCIVYIGSGKVGRSSHINSGISNCYELNRLHFAGHICDVEVLPCDNKTNADSLEIELVNKYLPRGNLDLFVRNLNNPFFEHIIYLLKEVKKKCHRCDASGKGRNLKPTAMFLFAIRYAPTGDYFVLSKETSVFGYSLLGCREYTNYHTNPRALFTSIDGRFGENGLRYDFIKTLEYSDDPHPHCIFTIDKEKFLGLSLRDLL